MHKGVPNENCEFRIYSICTHDRVYSDGKTVFRKFLPIDLSDDNWYAGHGRDATLYAPEWF